jgi:hypothetical protein
MTADRWRQIEQLYKAAQKVPPNERAALLESTDLEIRARVDACSKWNQAARFSIQPPPVSWLIRREP